MSFVTCRLFNDVVLIRRGGTGEGAGLLFGFGSVLDRTIRGRPETEDEVGWEFRCGAGGIGPKDGPGNLGANATTFR